MKERVEGGGRALVGRFLKPLSEESLEMAQVVPDFSEAQDFSPFPPGVYAAVIDSVENFDAKESKTPMIKVRFEISTDKKYRNKQGEEGSTQGRKVFRNFPLKGAGT